MHSPLQSIYNYGCQLLEASQALRISCRLDAKAIPQRMSQQLQHTWHRLQAISQEHMTRLRVSAVFHRSVEEYSQQLQELRLSVRNLKQTPNSSSGISSESDTRASPPIIIGGREAANDAPESVGSGGVEEGGETATDSIGGYADKSTTTSVALTGASGAAALLRDQLRKHLVVREQLLLEVGRMVRLGRLLKTRLKEPFVLDAVTGMRCVWKDFSFISKHLYAYLLLCWLVSLIVAALSFWYSVETVGVDVSTSHNCSSVNCGTFYYTTYLVKTYFKMPRFYEDEAHGKPFNTLLISRAIS